MAAKLKLTVLCGEYEIVRALREGIVKAKGIDLEFVHVSGAIINNTDELIERVIVGGHRTHIRIDLEQGTQIEGISLAEVIVSDQVSDREIGHDERR